MPWEKEGWPLLLPDELYHQVQEYVKDLCKRGLAINTAVVVVAAEGIVMNKNASLVSRVVLKWSLLMIGLSYYSKEWVMLREKPAAKPK